MPSLCFSQLSSGWSVKQGFMLFIAAAIPVPQSQYFSYMCDLLQLLSVCQYQAWIMVLQKRIAESKTET